MNIQFSYKNLTAYEKKQVDEYMNDKAARIEKWAKGEATLTVRTEKFSKKAAYKIELMFNAPSCRVQASEDDHTLREAVDLAVDKLVRQLERRRERAKPSHHKYPRERSIRERWDEIEERFDGLRKDGAAEREEFFRELAPLVTPAAAMLQHELNVWGDQQGEGEDITPEAIVDDAVLALWEERSSRPRGITLQQWFYRTALNLLNARREAKTHEDISMEKAVSQESAAFQVSNLGDEVKDFWQPDALLTIADTIGAKARGGLTPTQKKLYRNVLRSLIYLKSPARQAFLLRFREGFTPDEIALIQRRNTQTVENDIADAIAILKKKAKGMSSD